MLLLHALMVLAAAGAHDGVRRAEEHQQQQAPVACHYERLAVLLLQQLTAGMHCPAAQAAG
jgi:hypothetical protein